MSLNPNFGLSKTNTLAYFVPRRNSDNERGFYETNTWCLTRIFFAGTGGRFEATLQEN
jgi:hypothetical protein